MGADTVVVILESKDSKLKKSALEVASVGSQLAKSLQAKLEAIVFGSDLQEFESQLGECGVSKIHHYNDATFNQMDVHLFSPALKRLLQEIKPHTVLSSASIAGKDLMPRLAASFAVGMASDCTAIEVIDKRIKVKRPIYAGKAFVELIFSGKGPYFCTLRPNVFSTVKSEVSKPTIQIHSSTGAERLSGRLLEVKAGESKRVDLTEADIIVSGGRSLKSADNFKILFELADVMGASVGASRAAVDAGYAPHSMQVGQTGKVVSPKLYMAFGISGAIQHLAGMRTSKVIVAINTDPEAPLFKKADYGIVGDLFVIVPEITKAFRKLLSH
jgi:electron transfer flavoprotein alpha subunit